MPICRAATWRGRYRERWRTKPGGTPPVGTRNLVERGFTRTHTKWVTDITYIRTAEYWLYLCIVLDLYSGVIVGWSMSPRQDRPLVVQAVSLAQSATATETGSSAEEGEALNPSVHGNGVEPGSTSAMPGEL